MDHREREKKPFSRCASSMISRLRVCSLHDRSALENFWTRHPPGSGLDSPRTITTCPSCTPLLPSPPPPSPPSPSPSSPASNPPPSTSSLSSTRNGNGGVKERWVDGHGGSGRVCERGRGRDERRRGWRRRGVYIFRKMGSVYLVMRKLRTPGGC